MIASLLAAFLYGDPPAVAASFDPATNIYQITDRATGWTFLGQAIGQTSGLAASDGRDSVGGYHEISFNLEGVGRAFIRAYDSVRAVAFRLEYRKGRAGNGVTFPDFSAFPKGLKTFSFRDSTFAPATYSLAPTATPWLLFDEAGRSFVFSPASQFMVSRMVGDGRSSLGEGFDPKLSGIRPGMSQQSLIAFGSTIGAAWSSWGEVLRQSFHRPSASAADNDPLLRDFGYWTDNGADYYYNYDAALGYPGTLLALRDRYRQEGLPLGYVQLDSWWYSKSTDNPDGKPGGATKNARLPAGTWNRYGGTMEYRANSDLFLDGLAAFAHRLGKPLAVHGRWMDRNSPYHRDYRISGIAVTDPKWWNQTAAYLAACGVRTYEQDWLDPIYEYSPELAGQPGLGDAYTDAMAEAMARHGLSLQYCMATPRFFLQGLRHPNLTTIRTSGDRFQPSKWSEFLYGSQFADAMGIRPWCDVFRSGETGNMVLAVLSAGPVGTGDAIGRESPENILKAALPDGTVVRPDAPLLPADATYLAASQGRASDAPFWAATYTQHAGIRTTYLFAFRQAGGDDSPWSTRMSQFGLRGDAYLFDIIAGVGRRVSPDEPVSVAPSGHSEDRASYRFAYLMAAPILRSGIAVLGDVGKWTPTGKARVAEMEERRDGVHLRLAFAPNDRPIKVEGYAPNRPSAVGGVLTYDDATRIWTVDVDPAGRRGAELILKPH